MVRHAGSWLWVAVTLGHIAFGCGGDTEEGSTYPSRNGGAGSGGADTGGVTPNTGGLPASGGQTEGGGQTVGGHPAGGLSSGGHTGSLGGVPPTGGSAGSSGGGQAAWGGSVGQGGSGGAPGSVQYRACEQGGGFALATVFRIDPASRSCVVITFSDSMVNCLFGVVGGAWCLTSASISADVAACQAGSAPSGTPASGATGTMSFGLPGPAWSIDLALNFPASGGLPTAVDFQVVGCAPHCLRDDCRT